MIGVGGRTLFYPSDPTAPCQIQYPYRAPHHSFLILFELRYTSFFTSQLLLLDYSCYAMEKKMLSRLLMIVRPDKTYFIRWKGGKLFLLGLSDVDMMFVCVCWPIVSVYWRVDIIYTGKFINFCGEKLNSLGMIYFFSPNDFTFSSYFVEFFLQFFISDIL